MRRTLLAAGAIIWLTTHPLSAEITIDWETGDRGTAVVVRGLEDDHLDLLRAEEPRPETWRAVLAVRVDQPDVKSAAITPPMAGSYTLDDTGRLTFVPSFPLQAGLTYRALFDDRAGGGRGEPVVSVHTVAAKESGPRTSVTEIYPTAAVIPENLLKFYVHFSGPMSRGRIYEHIHLLDETGKEVEIPFLELDEELWNPEMTRVTLFIDPGRIKRGVQPLEEVGPSLESGHAYRLIIDAKWQDAEGRPLLEEFVKAFRVGPADREMPDPKTWKLAEVPDVGSEKNLVLRFPEPMDHALAQRLIGVTDAEGESVSGRVALEDEEKRWTFTPDSPWTAGDYHIRISDILEDLAGNQVGKKFEVDVFEEIDDNSLPKVRWVELPFRVAGE